MLKSRVKYICIFIILLVVECLIAIFLKSGFIRENVGDILVIPCIYAMLRIVFPKRILKLDLYVLLFAICIEFLQLFNITTLISKNNRILSIILGGTFDLKDIICYIVGYFFVLLFANWSRVWKY